MPAEASAVGRASVIICCYTLDRWRDLCAGVSEVQRQSDGTAQILVCVDHNDALLRRASESLTGVTVLENTLEPGLSGARNCALAQATGDVIVFLDDDAVPAPGWWAGLLQPFGSPGVMAVGGAAEPAWPDHRPSWFPGEFDWVIGCSYVGLPVRRAPVRNVMGCNMAFRADVFRAGLRFETTVGRTAVNVEGCEETELCIRIGAVFPEAQIVFEPGAVVRHRVPVSRCSVGYFVRRCYAEGTSKARVAGMVGPRDALSTEWTYTRRVLPRGVGRGLRDAVTGEVGGLGRSAAILLGLSSTSFGFARGRYAR